MRMSYAHRTAIASLAREAVALAEGIDKDAGESRARAARSAGSSDPYAVMQVRVSLDQEARNSIAQRKAAFNSRTSAAYNAAAEAYRKGLSVSPPAEALSLLQVLQMRKHLTQAEVDEASKAYGSNHQFASALAELAHANKLECADPIASQAVETLEKGKNSLIRCAAAMGQDGMSTRAKAAIMGEAVSDSLSALDALEGGGEE